MPLWLVRTAIALGLCLTVLLIRFRKLGSRPKNLPPGPPTLPILGCNLHSIFGIEDVHIQFQRWAEQYGPIYSLVLGTKTLLVINDRKVVKDLLDHKSNQYSSRPDMYVGQDLISGGYRLVFTKYDDEWRLARKMIHNLLNAKKAVDYLELKQMLSDFIDRPSAFHDHVRRYSTSLVTSFVFGWRSPSFNDPAVKQIYDGFEEFALASQLSSSLLDYYPILRKVPDFMNPMSRRAKALHKEELKLYKDYILRVRQRMQKGISPPCFCTEALFKAQEKHGFTDDWASYVSGTLLEAGSDTTASIFVGFIVAMVNFPRVQKKAQEELDRIVGPNRLPRMDDDMPYIRMIVKETLRYLPSSILGIVPHATSTEDYYAVGDESYYIPKGAGVMLNVWTLNNDPIKYPSPREFRPERYANDHLRAGESVSAVDVEARDHFTFGAGRRACPGLNVAERSLYLGIAQMLWALDFAHEKDAAGNDIPVDVNAMTGGIVARPKPFQCEITVRDEGRKKLAKDAWAECEKMLQGLPNGMRSTQYV
ncbi:hypothetical protein LTR85_009084 [Meristemomyces frigidus]|nr:hypothetical protein LTR85_009084 [Meristemomyces frigidus]